MSFLLHAPDAPGGIIGADPFDPLGMQLEADPSLALIPPPGSGRLTTWTDGKPTTTTVHTPITLDPGHNRLIDNENNAVITGTTGNNTIVEIGTGAAVTLGNGSSLVEALNGRETVTTGNGDQAIVLGGKDDSVTVGNTNGGKYDFTGIRTGDGGATVTGGNGNMIVSVGGKANTITLGTGNDVVFTAHGCGDGDDPTTRSTPAIVSADVIHLGNGVNHVFLGAGSGNTVYDGTGTDIIVGAHWGDDTFQINAGGGTDVFRGFGNLSNGDALDLTHILAGVTLDSDLSNLSTYVKVTSVTDTQNPLWTDTQLSITGVGPATAGVTLLNTGTQTLASLLSHDTLILPVH